MPNTDPIRIATEMTISYQGTVLMAIRVNMAIGEVKGMKEQIFIRRLSTLPLDMENMVTRKAMMNSIITGMEDVLISSTLEAVEPTAPNIKA